MALSAPPPAAREVPRGFPYARPTRYVLTALAAPQSAVLKEWHGGFGSDRHVEGPKPRRIFQTEYSPAPGRHYADVQQSIRRRQEKTCQ